MRVETAAGRLCIQANLGVVRFPEDGRNIEQLLNRGDQQMYRHKGVAITERYWLKGWKEQTQVRAWLAAD